MIDHNENDPSKLRKEIRDLEGEKLEQVSKKETWQWLFWILVILAVVAFIMWLHGAFSGPSDISGS